MTDAIQELRESMTQALRDVLEDLDRQITAFGDEEERDWIFEGMVADAVMFLASLPPLLPIPTVTIVEEDAEIIFEWDISDSRRAYVGLEGEGDFSYTLKRGDTYRPGLYEGRIGEELPEDLLEYLEG